VTTATQPITAVRAPQKERRVVQLDFVRGIAILLVLEYHFTSTPGTGLNIVERFFNRTGWMGVDLFFVLSGFLVGGLLVQELLITGGVRVRRFLVRRLLKIWPAYYFYLLVQIVIRRHPLSTFLWQNLLNVQNYFETSLKHTWSLAVEEHFYLLLPAALLLIYKVKFLRARTGYVLIGVCALVLAGRVCMTIFAGPGRWELDTHARLDELLFGVLLSYLLYSSKEMFHKLSQQRIVCIIATLLVFVIAAVVNKEGVYMATVGYSVNYLCFGCFVLLVYGYTGWASRTWLYGRIAWMGRYSYGIYLWHVSVRDPVHAIVAHLPHRIQGVALFIGEYVAAIVLGVLLTKAIEFPVLRIRDRLIPRGEAHLAPSAPA
jgi:peptidoglycan/LPS O-acetylase OafA/YrhL